jgi:SAM-dependent methyltransferase
MTSSCEPGVPSADRWRRHYSDTAASDNWVQAHGWRYSADVAHRTVDDIRNKLEIQPDDRVLDVGCGSGVVLAALLPPGAAGFGCDYTEGLLRKAGAFGVDPSVLRLVAAEAAAIPFADGSFDRVLCYSVFMHFPNDRYAERTVRECLRVCRPGGVVFIGDVPGWAENIRRTWGEYGAGLESAHAVLLLPRLRPLRTALLPARFALRVLRVLMGSPRPHASALPDESLYSHRMFRRIGESTGCNVEILPQKIPGREMLSDRFDVRVTRSATTSGARSAR